MTNAASSDARNNAARARSIGWPRRRSTAFFGPDLGDFGAGVPKRLGHAGGDGAGLEIVRGDGVFAELERQRARQSRNAGLRRAIGGQAVVGTLGHHGGDVDDAPGRRVPQMRYGALAQSELRGEIDGERLVPIGLGHRFGKRVRADAGIVHQDVEPAETGECIRNNRVGGIGIGDVLFECCDRVIAGVDVRKSMFWKIDREHARAFVREKRCAGGADPRSRTSDNGDASVEAHGLLLNPHSDWSVPWRSRPCKWAGRCVLVGEICRLTGGRTRVGAGGLDLSRALHPSGQPTVRLSSSKGAAGWCNRDLFVARR